MGPAPPPRPPRSYLVFDVETSGLPRGPRGRTDPRRLDVYDTCRVVELAWQIFDADTHKLLEENSQIWRPEGFAIPVAATQVHGIEQAYALEKGFPALEELRELMEAMARHGVERLVAHNAAFDRPVIASELARRELEGQAECGPWFKRWWGLPFFCTMLSTTELCKLPFAKPREGGREFKWPKLQELHKELFGEPFFNAHQALADVRATAKCYRELCRRGLRGAGRREVLGPLGV